MTTKCRLKRCFFRMTSRILESALLLLLLLLLLVAICTSPVQGIAVHVKFDGSLRPPSDHGNPTSSLARMAACAAYVSILPAPAVSAQDYRYCYLGGKLLVASSSTTSGEVEYEGLLFALEGCIRFLQTHATELQLSAANGVDVLVQGDCKTLVDQMRGISQPRKLEEYHQKASRLLTTISDATVSSRFQFQFQHIPRGENILCDRLSVRILFEHQDCVQRRMCHDIRNLWRQVQSTQYHKTSEEKNRVDLQTTYQSQLRSILDQYLTTGTSCVPLSARPVLYRVMARIAASLKDYSILLSLGNMYQADVDAVLRSRPKVPSICTSTTEPAKVQASSAMQQTTLIRHVEPIQEINMVQAIAFQLFALEALRRPKDARILERKFRWILERFRSETQQIRADLTSSSLHHDEVDYFPDYMAMDLPDREENEWPPVVNHWWENAVVSNSWNETQAFWSSSSSAIV